MAMAARARKVAPMRPAPAPASASASASASKAPPGLTIASNAGNSAMGQELYRQRALEQMRRATDNLELQLDTLKYRRNEQQKINDDQWAVARASEALGSVRNAFKGNGLRNLKLPNSSLWVGADNHLFAVRSALKTGNVVIAAHALQDFSSEYLHVQHELMDYIEGVIGGADLATDGLKVAVAAGAISASILTGGAAAAAGAGIVGTSAAVGVGAGLYGAAQEGAGQGGEIVAGTRESFDFKAIALRGGKDAIMGFVGTLAGGVLSKYAANYFGRLVMQRMKPDQIAAVAERLGVDATKLTPPVFLGKMQAFIVDFFAGAAVTPLTTAVESVLSRLEGGKAQTPEEFAKLVIKNAVDGGLMQLFLAPLMHGASRRPKKAERTIALGEPVPEAQLQNVQEGTAVLQKSVEPTRTREPIELPDVPPAPELQSAGDASAELQTQNWAERPDAIDLPEAGPLELQNVAEGTRDAQARTGEVVGVEPVSEPASPAQAATVAPTPATSKGKADTKKGSNASKQAKTAKPPAKAKAPKPEPFVVQPTSQGTAREVKAGSLLKKGKVQSNRIKGAPSRKTAKGKEQTSEQKSAERERRLEDTYKWKDRREVADELRRSAPKAQENGPKLKVGDPDPAFPGKKIKALHEDHLIPANKIRQMEGFAKLDVDTQNALLNTPENLMMVSEAVNTSRGDTPYSEYKGSKNLGIDADPAYVKQMAALEAQVEAIIRKRIRDALQARLNADWNTRLGMPEGYEAR